MPRYATMGDMTAKRVALVVTCVVVVGLAVVFGLVQWDRANRIAVVVSALAAVAAVGVAVWAALPSRSPGRGAVQQAAGQPGAANASGVGAVAVRGDSGGEVSTEVSGPAAASSAKSSNPVAGGVQASGAGAVAVGGDSTAPIRTKVTLDDDK